MAFVSTFNSLKKKMLQDSLERSITITPSNNTFTIDPNKGALFLVNITSNSAISISTLDTDYISTGSVFSILLTLSDDSYTVTWPNNINWADGEAPELSYKNLITLTKFDSSSDWCAGSIVVDDTFPSS